MDIDRVREFVDDQHHAVLATRSPEGIQQSPVLVAADDAGRFLVSTRETAYKIRNLRADPWAQLCVLPDTFFGTWYYVEGEAEILRLPEAMEPLVDYYRRAAGEPEDEQEYRAAMRRERRVLVRITPRLAGPERHG